MYDVSTQNPMTQKTDFIGLRNKAQRNESSAGRPESSFREMVDRAAQRDKPEKSQAADKTPPTGEEAESLEATDNTDKKAEPTGEEALQAGILPMAHGISGQAGQMMQTALLTQGQNAPLTVQTLDPHQTEKPAISARAQTGQTAGLMQMQQVPQQTQSTIQAAGQAQQQLTAGQSMALAQQTTQQAQGLVQSPGQAEARMAQTKSEPGQTRTADKAAETMQTMQTKSAAAEAKPQIGKETAGNSQPENMEGDQPAAGETPAKLQQTQPDKVFVKVSEGATAAQPEKFTADVGEKILLRASEGKQEFDIELTPKELGKINIKLIFEGGKAMILLHSNNPQTLQTLMANAEQLRHIVEAGTGMQTEVAAKDDAAAGMKDRGSDGRGENQARDEQEDRLNQERQAMQEKPSEKELSMFLQRFRLGIEQHLN